jgi:hypothetical protein
MYIFCRFEVLCFQLPPASAGGKQMFFFLIGFSQNSTFLAKAYTVFLLLFLQLKLEAIESLMEFKTSEFGS